MKAKSSKRDYKEEVTLPSLLVKILFLIYWVCEVVSLSQPFYLLTYLQLVPLLGHRPPTRVLQLPLSWAFLSS